MKKICSTFLVNVAFMLIISAVFAETPQSPPQAIQYPKTKIIYYLESDRHHVAALSPDGKVLWCCEAAPLISIKGREWYIDALSIGKGGDGKEYISIRIWKSGYGGGFIDMKTGVYTDSGNVL